ncbi:MAG: carboxymuconolactone decarboxylase family protein [Ktedonobacterales bacterium]
MLADWRTAPVTPKLRATLGLVEKLTLTPADVTPEDMEAVRAAGVSERAILDAINICAAFNLIDRVADALGFDIPASFTKGAASLLQRGYKL